METEILSVVGSDDLAARIAALETELALLKTEQRARLVAVIVATVGPGVVFSAAELWQHQRVSLDLRDVLTQLQITNARQLGKRLYALRGVTGPGGRLERLGDNNGGALWIVTVADHCHQRACDGSGAGA